MGLSGNQARFLSITARQIDLEHRVQQICQRRLRLSSQLQRAATAYNDATSNRHLFINKGDSFSSSSVSSDYQFISSEVLLENDYHVYDNTTGEIVMPRSYPPKTVEVRNATELLQALAGNKSVRMMGDIDLTSTSFTTLNNFSGKLFADGNTLITNKTLFNTIGENGQVFDLIAQTSGAGATFAQSYSGLIANTNNGLIDNVMVNGTINANNKNYVGSLVGVNIGTLSNASSFATITGGSSNIGGLVGTNSVNGTLDTVLFAGSVTGQTTVGGVCGSNYGEISKATLTGTITGTNLEAGGIVGRNTGEGTITSTLAAGIVNGKNNVGGIVGLNESSASITNSYAISNITSTGTNAGSIAGINNSIIGENTYFIPAQTNESSASGLAGAGSTNNALSLLNFTYLNDHPLSDEFIATTVMSTSSPTTELTLGTPAKVVTIPTVEGSNIVATGEVQSMTIPLLALNDSNVHILTPTELAAAGATAQQYSAVIASAKTGAYSALNIDPESASPELAVISYQDYDATGNVITNYSIGVYSSDALKALDENSFNSGNAGTKTAALSSSYTMMRTTDLAGYNWTPVGDATNAFTGTFNGNNATKQDDGTYIQINNMSIDQTGIANSRYVGFFGSSRGTIKEVTLAGATIALAKADGAITWDGQVGGIVGFNSGGLVQNCNAGIAGDGILITVAGSAEDIGGLVGTNDNDGTIDKCSATGTMLINTSGGAKGGGDIGGLIGWQKSGATTLSSANMDIITKGTISYLSAFVSDGGSGTLTNCYSAGTINTNGGAVTQYSTYLSGISSGTPAMTATNSYMDNGNGTYDYWDTNKLADGAPSNNDINYATLISKLTTNTAGMITVGGQQVSAWNTDGTLNMTAVNTRTVNVPQLDSVTSPNTLLERTSAIDLETGLRNGTYSLAKEADAMTQSSVAVRNKNYEIFDWRTTPIVSDELYEADDEEAQTIYERTIRDVNAQDKQLELEQTNITTEYTAVTSEKEAVKKILDTNSQASFKYFG